MSSEIVPEQDGNGRVKRACFTHRTYDYTHQNRGASCITFRCKHYRPKSKETRQHCTASLKLSLDGKTVLKDEGEHFCRSNVLGTTIISAVAEMRKLGEERALITLGQSAKEAYEDIYAEMLTK